MSACLSSGGGGAAAYSFELEKMKSPPPPPPSSSTTTRATSPSSTISESSNSPLAISTRKPRTPRKRPNQTYNEAAALLSTAYPNIFSSSSSSSNLYAKKKTHPNPFAKSPLLSDYEDASELLLESIEEPDFLFLPTIQARSSEYFSEQKEVNSGGEISVNQFEFSDEFDAESILDEEIGEGIDSIMGIVESNSGENRGHLIGRLEQMMMMNRKGFKFAPLGLGLRSALREHNDANWCRFHTVDFEQISPRIQSTATAITVEDEKTDSKKLIGEKSKKKKKKKVAALPMTESKRLDSSKEDTEEKSGELMLKLDYDGVLEAWSEKESPFADDILGSESTGADVNARLAQIDLFGDNGVREASVLRYKEKRRTRLFSKKIRYQVRKVNADQRPRMKGRFVRRPNASLPSETKITRK